MLDKYKDHPNFGTGQPHARSAPRPSYIIKCPTCYSSQVRFDAHAGAVVCLSCGLTDYSKHVEWIKERRL